MDVGAIVALSFWQAVLAAAAYDAIGRRSGRRRPPTTLETTIEGEQDVRDTRL